jgi:WhiB family transcriptional regulator, redox-sensing transcriptional regulator
MTNWKPLKITAISWMDNASCVGEDANLWFPNDKDAVNKAKQAKVICADCPVKMQCLELALTERISYGIWGGLTSDERDRLRQSRYNLARRGI